MACSPYRAPGYKPPSYIDMNKKSLLFRGVFFGYAATGAQIFYSFASIPLALSHLSKAEFGMWSLITTLTTYLSMAEMGIMNAFMRHLFECKDGKDPLRYGRLFTACTLATLIIAVMVLLLGSLVSVFTAPWLRIPVELQGTYFKVMLGQTVATALYQATRMFGAPLYVHHRQDLGNISQIGLFLIYYVVLHLAFEAGWGIYSMLASQAAGLVWALPFYFVACFKRGYYPQRETWGLPARDEWLSVWQYSRDQLIVQLAGLLLMGLPQLLVSRLLGLEAAALWAVCTRPFAILKQTFFRPFNVALPMLYDIFIRGDMRMVTKRWCDISQMVLAVSICGFAVAAANNSVFVSLWTGGEIAWAEANNWMTALYFMIYTVAGLSYGTIGLSKSFGNTRFIPIFQALLTLLIAYPMAKIWGMPGLILATALPYVIGMIWFGVRYLASITGQPLRPLVTGAFLRPFLVIPLAILAAWGCSFLKPLLPGYFGLFLSSGSGFAVSLMMAIFIGVSRDNRGEMTAMILRPFKRFM
jgi:O-antigen/teichoic acid export membrane protein